MHDHGETGCPAILPTGECSGLYAQAGAGKVTAQAPARRSSACLGAGAAISRTHERAGRDSRKISVPWRMPPNCLLRSRPICVTPIPLACSPAPMREVVRLHASSGTTGKPIVVAYTQDDLEVWTSVMARSFGRCRRARGRHRAELLRLRTVHRRAGLSLRSGAAGSNGHSGFGRQYRPPDHAHAAISAPRSCSARPPTFCT